MLFVALSSLKHGIDTTIKLPNAKLVTRIYFYNNNKVLSMLAGWLSKSLLSMRI